MSKLDVKFNIDNHKLKNGLWASVVVFDKKYKINIPLLIKYFSKKISQSYNIKELDIDENDSYILNHNWQGNVRELRNLIERIAILQPDTKDKISNIVKESLKNNNFDEKMTENSLSVPLK